LAGIYVVIKLVTRWFTCISRFHNHRQLPLVAISHWANTIKNKFLKKQMSRNLFIYYFKVSNLLITFNVADNDNDRWSCWPSRESLSHRQNVRLTMATFLFHCMTRYVADVHTVQPLLNSHPWGNDVAT